MVLDTFVTIDWRNLLHVLQTLVHLLNIIEALTTSDCKLVLKNGLESLQRSPDQIMLTITAYHYV